MTTLELHALDNQILKKMREIGNEANRQAGVYTRRTSKWQYSPKGINYFTKVNELYNVGKGLQEARVSLKVIFNVIENEKLTERLQANHLKIIKKGLDKP